MTETEARQVLLLQALEQAHGALHSASQGDALRAAGADWPERGRQTVWTAADSAWATREAVAAVGDQATPQAFVAARAGIGLQRLLPRDAAARRWLERRAWHPAWVWLAALLGFGAGLLADQLGPPQHVNLLAPAVWAVVAWNLAVYAAALLPWPGSEAGSSVQRLLARRGRGGGGHHDGAALLWARHAAPLSLARAALVLHAAAAMLAVGLMAGLYLRGLVLDYRAGWQSTFLSTPQVQAVLDALLAPASALTGIALPDVAPLRVGPGAPATASAAPWIHLYAATLALWVVLPRALLALWSGLRARGLARRFPLPLDTAYFEGLHPLMRPGMSRTVRLLWAAPAGLAPVVLLGRQIDGRLAPMQPVTLLSTDEGDDLQLMPAPIDAVLDGAVAAVPVARGWWQRRPVGAGSAAPSLSAPSLAALRAQTDAVLWVTRHGTPFPAWLAALQRPVLALHDAATAEPPALPLRNLAAGWLADGRWLQALQTALPGDSRVQRLAATWATRQQARLEAVAGELAASLGRVGAARAAVADDGLLARRSAAEAAQQTLAASLQLEWQASTPRPARLAGDAGPTPEVNGLSVVDARGLPAVAAPGGGGNADGDDRQLQPAAAGHDTLPSAAALRNRVGEGSAALVGGVTTGALAGLKADIATGGLTMGAGMVVGALLGAVTAAGLARGVNVVRGTDRSFAAWDAQALALLTEAWLLRQLVALHHAPDAARGALQAALAAHRDAWAGVWKARSQRFDNPGEDQRLADALRAPLTAVLRDALARLHAAPAGAATPSAALAGAGTPPSALPGAAGPAILPPDQKTA